MQLELFYGGSWVDITAANDVFTAPIVIKQGQSDEGSAFRPCSISCQLANDDDRYRTSNPMSPLYGLAGRNAPMRVTVGGSIRGVTEASSWAADQTRDFRASPRRGKAWVDLEGGGLLRRIGQWTDPLRSPFYVYNAALTTSIGYWPLEDAGGTAVMAQAAPGNAVTTNNPGVTFGTQNRHAGSAPLAGFANSSKARGYFKTGGDPDSTAGWQVSFTAQLGSLGELGSFQSPVTFEMLNGVSYAIAFTDGINITLLANAFPSGATLINTVVNIDGLIDWSRWVQLIFRCTYSAGTTTVSLYAFDEDSFITNIVNGSFSGATSYPKNWRLSGGGFDDTVTYGHMIATVGVTEDLTDPARQVAFLGHPGERSAIRFGRLCDLAGVPYYVSASYAKSIPMGPQPYGTLADNLKEIAATEDGLIFDYRFELRLLFTLRPDRYRQTPVLTLTPADFPANAQGGLPVEVTDDLDTHNIITVSQRDGLDYTAEDSTGPLGSAPPPVGVGEARQTVDVNLDAAPLVIAQHANWWLRRGTVNLPRFPQVTLDLNARPSLIAAAQAVDVGEVIQITGFRENTIRLWVLGWTEVIRTHGRTITFTCAPDQQFNVGAWDSTTSRWDSLTHSLKSAVNTTATALVFRSLSSKVSWSTATPYDVFIAGERLTVTAMGAAALVGGGYDQAATVTRSVNGIVKNLGAGEPVHVADPGRWA